MSFSEEKLAEIRQRVAIGEVIGEYVQLTQSGKSFRGLCPFHQEKTPSFYVSPERETFHCFGCGEGGTVFHFLMKIEGFSFSEAVKKMADRGGIELNISHSTHSQSGKKKERLLELHRQAAWYYHCYLKNLPETEEVWAYLNQRQIKAALAEKFYLGFCPPQNSGLEKKLLSKGFTPSELQKSGLFKGNREFFRGRLLFPIFRFDKKVVGFGGRLINEKHFGPKYINSPESMIFKKGELFYGMHTAKESIRKTERVMIAEGYMDVIALHAHGFGEAVAPLGTALTLFHVKTLKRLAQELILVFDGDTAGQKATLKALEIILEQDIVPTYVALESDEDPDSLLKTAGQLVFEKKLKNRRNLLENLIDKWSEEVLQNKNLELKGRVAQRCLKLIKRIPDYFRRRLYQNYLANALQVPETWLESWEQNPKAFYNKVEKPNQARGENLKNSLQLSCLPEEEAIFETWLKFPHLREELKKEISPEDFFSENGKKIAQLMWSWKPKFMFEDSQGEAIADFLNLLSEEENRYLSALLMKEKLSEEISSLQSTNIDQVILQLQEKKLKYEIRALPKTLNDLGVLKNKIEALAQVVKNKERLYGQN